VDLDRLYPVFPEIRERQKFSGKIFESGRVSRSAELDLGSNFVVEIELELDNVDVVCSPAGAVLVFRVSLRVGDVCQREPQQLGRRESVKGGVLYNAREKLKVEVSLYH
jgi:hypothetical protein